MEKELTKLESVILKHLKGKYLPKRFSSGRNIHFSEKDLILFSKGAAKLSESFTIGRSELTDDYLNRPEMRSGYLLYFTLTNVAKVFHLLKRLDDKEKFSKKKDIKLLDIGCGPASGALAASLFFTEKRLTAIGVDQNKEILNDGLSIFNQIKANQHRFIPLPERFGGGKISQKILSAAPFDIIIASNFINEIKNFERRMGIIDDLLKLLSNDGFLIIIEPALQRQTRELMHIHDVILKNKMASVIEPCPHQEKCPMLAHNKRDWCHTYINWSAPKTISDVDDLLGIKHDYLKL